jgi:hypothetical protein
VYYIGVRHSICVIHLITFNHWASTNLRCSTNLCSALKVIVSTVVICFLHFLFDCYCCQSHYFSGLRHDLECAGRKALAVDVGSRSSWCCAGWTDLTRLRYNYILNVHKVGLYSTRFLIDRVRVLLLNEFLYWTSAQHKGSKETSSVTAQVRGLSKSKY